MQNYGFQSNLAPVPPSTTNTGYRGTAQAMPFRSALDLARSGYPTRTPDAQYPAGYLDSLQSRREDRVLYQLNKANSRQYQRGPLRGSMVNINSYIWPEEFNDQSGLALESKGSKFVSPQWIQGPPSSPNLRTKQWPFPPGQEPVSPNGAMEFTGGLPPTAVPPDNRVLQMKTLLPSWR